MLQYCEHCPDKPTCKEICLKVRRYLSQEGVMQDRAIVNSKLDNNLKDVIIANCYPDELLSEDFAYCLDHMLSTKERQVIEHLVEGYTDDEIFDLMRKVFPTKHAYRQTKSKAKIKILSFLK